MTSPSPENLHTLFEFVFKGFDALDYQVGKYCSHTDRRDARPEITQKNDHVAEHSMHDIVGSVKIFPGLFVLLYFNLFVAKYDSNFKSIDGS